MKILITGSAGFIGMHVARLLIARGDTVIGIDNLNDYYAPSVKLARLEQLIPSSLFRFIHVDIADQATMDQVFATERPQRVIHLAAQPGVRYSLKHPQSYIQSNLVGFSHVLEGCRHYHIEHLVYASSSSVYGLHNRLPLSVHDSVDYPTSLYGASKKANELMAHAYSHLYGLPTTGLRYFSVYGPWGRPDMCPWLFTSAIDEGRPLDIFNQGNIQRDFTFIDDVAEGTVRILDHLPLSNQEFSTVRTDAATSSAPYKLYNMGSQLSVDLLTFIALLEEALGKKAKKNFLPMQPGDILATQADVQELKQDIGFEPCTPLEQGIDLWIEWYLEYGRRFSA